MLSLNFFEKLVLLFSISNNFLAISCYFSAKVLETIKWGHVHICPLKQLNIWNAFVSLFGLKFNKINFSKNVKIIYIRLSFCPKHVFTKSTRFLTLGFYNLCDKTLNINNLLEALRKENIFKCSIRIWTFNFIQKTICVPLICFFITVNVLCGHFSDSLSPIEVEIGTDSIGKVAEKVWCSKVKNYWLWIKNLFLRL